MQKTSTTAHILLIATLLITPFTFSCGSENLVVPDGSAGSVPDPASSAQQMADESNRVLWGLWDIAVQKSTGRFEIVPAREANLHLNALAYLEPPALTGLTFDTGTLEIDVPGNYVGVDIILTHPFSGMDQFSGFDVRGIVLLPGTEMPFGDPSLIFSSAAEPRLLNPDGWTRWWNPKEFPMTGIFGYQEGLIGESGGAGIFTATINGYKYFADGLGENTDVLNVPVSGRGSFSAGSTNRRHYDISFGDDPADWLHFQYAVDACWVLPSTMNDPQVPDDFPGSANAPEGYAVNVEEIENTLWWLDEIGMGGNLKLEIDVYTWRPDAIDRVILDAPGIISAPMEGTLIGGSSAGEPVYSTYEVQFEPDVLVGDGVHECLIVVESSEDYTQDGTTIFFGPSGTNISGYYRYQTNVSWIPPLSWQLVTAKLLPLQPATTISEISVVGRDANKGVYFFGDEYRMYRYDLGYEALPEHVTTLGGFFGYSELDLYGYPEDIGRFEICPFGQLVASTITSAPSPTFLGGLKRDYAFFFNEFYSISGQLPMQIGIPNPDEGYFRFVDTAANWADEIEDAKIYWIQIDDPDESTEPNPLITVILGVYQHEFSGNPFTKDITYLTGSLVPAGNGDGLVDLDSVARFALDGDPQGVTGSTDLICWFMETDSYALECFSVVSSDDSGDLNQHLTTIKSFHATPRDIAVMPTHQGGYSQYNWLVVLEEGTGEWCLECFDQTGASCVSLLDIEGEPIVGYPYCLDIDPERYQVHVWYTVEIGGPMYAAVFELGIN